MSLEIDGVPILSQGDFTEIMRGMADQEDTEMFAPLAAWFYGQPVPAEEIFDTLNIECRAQDIGENPRVAMLIDAALDNLRDGFPGLLGGLDLLE